MIASTQNSIQPKAPVRRSAFTGAAIVMSPLTFLFIGLDLYAGGLSVFRVACALAALLCTFFMSIVWNRHQRLGRMLAACDALACVGAAGSYIASNPFASLSVVAAVSMLLNAVFSESSSLGVNVRRKIQQEHLEYAAGAVGGFIAMFLMTWGIYGLDNGLGLSLSGAGGIICQYLLYKWFEEMPGRSLVPQLIVTGCLLLIAASFFVDEHRLIVVFMCLSIFIDMFLVNSGGSLSLSEELNIDFFLNRPARFILITFVVLCTIGSILLYLPISRTAEVSFIDSAFMAVSASCVTGLTVVDVDKCYTPLGQFVIVMLIELGGLGMMGMASVAMHAMGRRLSLRHERLLADMSESDSGPNLMRSLYLVIYYVLAAEGIGSILIFLCLMCSGMEFLPAIGKAVFLAVSAFCNAGISPFPGNMMMFANNDFMLYTVALLVLCGGMAPATFLAIPNWISGKRIPLSSYLALMTTGIILAGGIVGFTVLEWEGIFKNLTLENSFSNIFFYVTVVRTAGFNSIDVSGLSVMSTILTMIIMVIGGNPGGTAGGIKTVTVAVIFLSFWADITQSKSVTCMRRTIPQAIVRRTITIVAAFCMLLFASLLMLFATQNIPGQQLCFEAVSALATMGMSLGATSQLDEIGKAIIMISMFIGRIGPITLFALITDENPITDSCSYPEEKISLT